MTKELFLVAYEGDEGNRRVLDFAIRRAHRAQAAVLLVHVIEWSPYSFLGQEELARRSELRKQELAGAQEQLIDPAMKVVQDAGLEARSEIRFGQVAPMIAEIADARNATLIFVGRSGRHAVASRVFGSVPLALAQIATVPTVIVP